MILILIIIIKHYSYIKIRRFIKSFKKFPAPDKRLDEIAADAELNEKPMSELSYLADQLRSRCDSCLAESETSVAKENKTDDDESKGPGRKRRRGPTFKLGGVMVNAKSFSAAVTELEPLDQALPMDSEQRANWNLDIKYICYRMSPICSFICVFLIILYNVKI
jgi:chromodomain-helicase-DNA-binding protein 1